MADQFFLGETVDPAAHERTGDRLDHDPADLTTHGVIVGMTGSGKTGLGVVLLEEALRAGIPTLVLDPKGDMTNLALRFPGLTPEEFAPWVAGDGDPAATAATWKDGLATWGLDGSHIQSLTDTSRVTVYTPGSTAGVALDLIGSLAAPEGVADAEARADEVEGLASGLLSMVGIEADPLSSREHILLTNLIDRAWSQGKDLDLGLLVQQIQDPPIRKLGVLELDSFYPAADRTKLALKLNGLLASPSFASWAQGVPVDIDAMLSTDADGRGGAACSVIYLAHLSEEERQFVVTLLLSKLITWMRGQPGSPDLRALVYMDEVFGYVPPTAVPPAKKPILTILKQARAFGVGMVLSTQNPVDLDYKAISNAGTWMVGRLQTERDVDRLADGLRNASGSVDIDQVRATIAGLGKREFLLHTTKGSAPRVFTTRWALDYLAGPLTREQLADLPGQPDADALQVAPSSPGSSARATVPMADRPIEVGDDETTVVPEVADGIPVRWVDPAAPWVAEVGGDPDGNRLRAGVAARIELLYDETKADLRHTEEFECVLLGLDETFDAGEVTTVDYDDRDLRDQPPDGAVYELPDAPIATKGWFSDAEKAIEEWLYANRTLTLPANQELKLYGRPGESADDFAARCQVAAGERADAEAEKLRSRLEKKMDTVRRAIEREEIRVSELEAKAKGSKTHEVVSAAGDLLSSFIGGKRSTRSILGKVKGVSSRRKSSSAAAQRVESALAKVDQKEAELTDLESELIDALADIEAEWDEAAGRVTELEVGLEKSDIRLTQLALIWVPC